MSYGLYIQPTATFYNVLTKTNNSVDAEPDASVGNSTAERHEEYEDLPPKLEEYLAEDCLPNFLNVIDQGQCTSGNQGKLEPGVRFADSTPVVHTYIRQYPAPGINCDAVACLVLSPTNLHGAGRHSSIYRAKFTLPCSLTTNARSDGTVTVIAKTAFDAEQDRKELKEEARLYREMSKTPNRHLQMGWDGYVTIPGFEAEFPAEAIVPKFYGYYKPPEGSDGLSPILLMEDCGKPAASIDQLGQYDR